MTASISLGGIGKGCQLRSRHCFKPWNRPQSTSTWRSPVLTRCLDPVTVPAAPRNWMYAIQLPLLWVGHLDRGGVVRLIQFWSVSVVHGQIDVPAGHLDSERDRAVSRDAVASRYISDA